MTNHEIAEEMTDKEYFANHYDVTKYPHKSLTADLTIFTIQNEELCILLVKRGGRPFKGSWALPGGFVKEESVEDAAIRELKEETNISIDSIHLEQLKTYANPGRDPRGYVASVAFLALVPNVAQPVAGDDAAEAKFIPVSEVLGVNEDGTKFPLAFDHEQIIRDGLQRARDKIEWAPLAPTFLTGEFTLSDLRRVYEIVWGIEKLHAPNFCRKVQSVENFVLPTGKRGQSQFEGGRLANLYTTGKATNLFPPILRPANGVEVVPDTEE